MKRRISERQYKKAQATVAEYEAQGPARQRGRPSSTSATHYDAAAYIVMSRAPPRKLSATARLLATWFAKGGTEKTDARAIYNRYLELKRRFANPAKELPKDRKVREIVAKIEAEGVGAEPIGLDFIRIAAGKAK